MIHHSEKITATLGDRQGSHDVHMHMSKTAGRRFKNLNRVAGVFLHFGGLTRQASSCQAGNVFLRVVPHKVTKDEAHGCLDSWVRKAVYKIENGLDPCCRN